jgi:hypothetical protein
VHAGPGRGNKTLIKNDCLSKSQTTTSRIVARLKRDRPEIAEALSRAEYGSAPAGADQPREKTWLITMFPRIRLAVLHPPASSRGSNVIGLKIAEYKLGGMLKEVPKNPGTRLAGSTDSVVPSLNHRATLLLFLNSASTKSSSFRSQAIAELHNSPRFALSADRISAWQGWDNTCHPIRSAKRGILGPGALAASFWLVALTSVRA